VLIPIPLQNGVAPAAWSAKDLGAPAIMHRRLSSLAPHRRGVQPERIKAQAGTWLLGPAVDSKPYFPTYGGIAGITNTTPYATVRGHPSGGKGPQWIELGRYGRFWGYNRDVA